MTFDLKTMQPLAGESPLTIRSILRRSVGAFRQDWLTDKFGYNPQKAHAVATAMLDAGLVERDSERETRNDSRMPWFNVTEQGWSIARASAARRISRQSAEIALNALMKRVQLANANSQYLYSVTSVVVFGSYLEACESLGDVDVTVELQPRIPISEESNWIEIFRLHAWDSGRSFSTLEDEIDWPRREVLLFLKSRKRSIHLQSWFSFVEMKDVPGFRFEFLLGGRKNRRRLTKEHRRG